MVDWSLGKGKSNGDSTVLWCVDSVLFQKEKGRGGGLVSKSPGWKSSEWRRYPLGTFLFHAVYSIPHAASVFNTWLDRLRSVSLPFFSKTVFSDQWSHIYGTRASAYFSEIWSFWFSEGIRCLLLQQLCVTPWKAGSWNAEHTWYSGFKSRPKNNRIWHLHLV